MAASQAVRGPVGPFPSATDDLRLPTRVRARGPLVQARVRRSMVVYGLLVALGMLPVLLGASVAWRAFGLGLLVPGGGFLLSGPLWAPAAVLVLLAGAGLAWFGAGMIVAPAAVWLGSALLAGAGAATPTRPWAEPVVPLAAALVVVVGMVGNAVARRGARSRAVVRNRYLAAVARRSVTAPAGVTELSERDLAATRGLVDLALQPLEEFAGYDLIDQFQTAAIRYQINFATYALQMAQLAHTPAFTGYLSEAQRRLIDKMTVRRVWSYWFWENLWGNLRLDPDPIARDNIMLSGYLGLMVGAYEALSGDGRYDREGALTFQWSDGRAYRYDHARLASAVHRNFADSPWGMFPCEPNWIYSACNTFGMNTLLLHDRLHGTDYAAGTRERFVASLDEEFLTADGRVTAIRSSRLGLTIPSLTSTMADAGMVLFTNPIAPDFARRLWEIVRNEFVHVRDDGLADLVTRGWDRIDTGNYRPSNVSPLGIVLNAAREMGDVEVADALARTVEARFAAEVRDGVLWHDDASTQGNGMLAFARFNRANGFHDLVNGADGVTGPRLVDVPYPTCLVALAVTDGAASRFVLRASVTDAPVRLAFDRLSPHASYTLRGAPGAPNVRADGDGRAELDVVLRERSELELVPGGAEEVR